jgi:hypothetical protein
MVSPLLDGVLMPLSEQADEITRQIDGQSDHAGAMRR